MAKNFVVDKSVIKNFYYKKINNLTIRLKTYKKYGTNKLFFTDWIVKNLNFYKYKNAKYLDIGCGTGDLLKFLNLNYPEVELFGIDISECMVDSTRKKNSKFDKNFLVADVENIPYADLSFDIISSIHVMHHVSCIDLALKEMFRICKIGGIIFLTSTDYKINKGLNKIHYEALKELNFPNFMFDSVGYLQFNKENAEKRIKKMTRKFKIVKYFNKLSFEKLEPILDYYQSAMMFRNTSGLSDLRIKKEKWAQLYELVRQKIKFEIKAKKHFDFGDVVYGYKINK